MKFGEAIVSFFKNYINFAGRARRSEFWYAVLFCWGVTYGLGFLNIWVDGGFSFVLRIWQLGAIIPFLSLAVRRLHDIGKSGKWVLCYLIPLYGFVCFIEWNRKDSCGNNEWGISPKAPDQDTPFWQPEEDAAARPEYRYPAAAAALKYEPPVSAMPAEVDPDENGSEPESPEPKKYEPEEFEPEEFKPEEYEPEEYEPEEYEPEEYEPPEYDPETGKRSEFII